MKKIIQIITLLFVSIQIADAQNPCNPDTTVAGYVVNPIPFNPFSITGNTLTLLTDDGYSDSISIGFTFNFYGIDYTYLLISANGTICFNNTLEHGYCQWPIGEAIPSTSAPRNSIFAIWQDLNPSQGGTIRYQTLGTAPYRMFVVSMDSVQLYSTYDCPGDFYTGQIVLYETSNWIDIYVTNKPDCTNWDNGYGIEGIQDSTGTQGLAVPGRNYPTTFTVQNDGQRFSRQTFYGGSFPPPAICMVSVDTSINKSIVIWNQLVGVPVDSFYIYRETSQAGVYAQIGAQAQNVFSTFTDTSSIPPQQANRYAISFKDTCGFITPLSPHHKTIHLSVNQGVGNTWNLDWDAYQGLNFLSYDIYRGTSTSNMTLLNSVASTLYQFTDLNPPNGTVYYMIAIADSIGCNPSARMEFSNSISMSNLVSTAGVGIPSVLNRNLITINPNPTSGIFSLIYNSTSKIYNSQFNIFDVTGRKVFSQPIINLNQSSIDISYLSNGIYYWEMTGDKGIEGKGKIAIIKN